jgi:hypothetical protein
MYCQSHHLRFFHGKLSIYGEQYDISYEPPRYDIFSSIQLLQNMFFVFLHRVVNGCSGI